MSTSSVSYSFIEAATEEGGERGGAGQMAIEPRVRDQENSSSWCQYTFPKEFEFRCSCLTIVKRIYYTNLWQPLGMHIQMIIFFCSGEGMHHPPDVYRVRGKLSPPDRFQGSNTGHRAWCQVPLHTTPILLAQL